MRSKDFLFFFDFVASLNFYARFRNKNINVTKQEARFREPCRINLDSDFVFFKMFCIFKKNSFLTKEFSSEYIKTCE